MGESATAIGTIDLQNCEREPIHIPGCIQPHGILLALDPGTLTILQLAGDTVRFFGLPASKLLGQGLGTLASPAAITRLRAISVMQVSLPRSVFTFETGIEHRGQPFDAIVHLSDGVLVVELEPRLSSPPINALDQVQSMIMRVQSAPQVPDFLQAAAEEVRAATGFDRVMIYRFEPDDSGTVIAEAKDEALVPISGIIIPPPIFRNRRATSMCATGCGKSPMRATSLFP